MALRTCNPKCCSYYKGKYTGKHFCYEQGEIEVQLNQNCLHGLEAIPTPTQNPNEETVPVKKLSSAYYTQLIKFHESSRARPYIPFIADEADAERAGIRKAKKFRLD